MTATAPTVFEFRGPGEGDLAGIVELLRRAFGAWPTVDASLDPIEHLRWKMHSPLAEELGDGGTVIALDRQRVTGLSLGIPRRVKVGGSVRAASDAVDTAIDPDYQGRGFYSGLQRGADARRAAVDFMLYSPGKQHPAFRSRPGREFVPLGTPITKLAFVFDARRLAAEIDLRAPRIAIASGLEVLRAIGRVTALAFTRSTPEPAVRRVERFSDEIDRVWEAASADFDVAIERRAAYLNWRYAHRGGGRYGIVVAEDGGGVIGYAVWRGRGARAFLVDLLVAPGRGDAIRAVVRRAITDAVEAGARSALVCWLPRRHPYARVLRRLGFIDLRQPTRIRTRRHRLDVGGLEPLADPRSRLHYTHGDTDLV